MNANELADALDWVCENQLVGIGDADFKAIATMLRQQQAEIEALKKEAALQKLSDFTQEVEAKYSDAWWKEVDEFNKQLKVQEK
jgi:hypothetical protein